MASGQLEFAVSQQPSLLCVQRQVLEKKRNTRHITHSAETNTVMVNKLNAFSFSFFTFPAVFPPALLTRLSCPSFHFSINLERKKKSADYRRPLRKAHRGFSFEISIFDLGNHLVCGFGPTSLFWSSFRCNLSSILKGRVNSGTPSLFHCLPLLSSFNNIVNIED